MGKPALWFERPVSRATPQKRRERSAPGVQKQLPEVSGPPHSRRRLLKATSNAIADDGKKATARPTGAYGRACHGWGDRQRLRCRKPIRRAQVGRGGLARARAVGRGTRGRRGRDRRGRAGGQRDRADDLRFSPASGARKSPVALTWSLISAGLVRVEPSRSEPHEERRRSHRVRCLRRSMPIITSVHWTSRCISTVEKADGELRVCLSGLEQGPFPRLLEGEDRAGRGRRRRGTGRLHDLRRTAATGLQRLGVRLESDRSGLEPYRAAALGSSASTSATNGPMRNARRSTPGASMSRQSSRDARRPIT